MPRTLSSFALQEKNKLTSPTVWLLMLEITIPGESVPVRITDNNESVTWRGESWIAFPFQLDPMGEESRGEVPQTTLRVSNVTRAMESYLQAYDLYTKINGWSPIQISIYVVNNQGSTSGSGVITDTSGYGAVTDSGSEGALTDSLYSIVNPDPEAVFEYELTLTQSDSMWVTFNLGAANPFNKRFPMNRMMKNHCGFKFKDVMCGYSGAGATCNKTLTACRSFTDSAYHNPPNSLGNSTRFGGYPGIGIGGLRLA